MGRPVPATLHHLLPAKIPVESITAPPEFPAADQRIDPGHRAKPAVVADDTASVKLDVHGLETHSPHDAPADIPTLPFHPLKSDPAADVGAGALTAAGADPPGTRLAGTRTLGEHGRPQDKRR